MHNWQFLPQFLCEYNLLDTPKWHPQTGPIYNFKENSSIYFLNPGLIGIQVVDMLIDTHGLSMGLSF
jgi:hypothetical protein